MSPEDKNTAADLFGNSALADSRAAPPLAYGPWSPTCDRVERGRQLRGMSALVLVYFGPSDLFRALRAAEGEPIAFIRAQELVEALPSLRRRHLLAAHARVTWPRSGRVP
jgi:hypothetical protein